MNDSQDLLEVLSSVPSSSSGMGTSYYGTRCARKARLDKEFPEATSSFNARVGVVFHKILELYYAGKLKDVALPLDDMADFEKDPVQEALRLFEGYAQFYPADEWEVLGVEVQLPGKGEDAATDESKILSQMGVPFTARLDMVVRLNEAQAAAFKERRRLEVDPGVYIVDHKTTDKRDFNAQLRYQVSRQFSTYPMMYEAVYQEPVKGVIVNQCIRHKRLVRDSFNSFYVPAPTEGRKEAIRAYLKWKQEYLKTDQCNLDACDDWGICLHYMSGNCNME